VGKVKSLGRKVKLYFEKRRGVGSAIPLVWGVGIHPSPYGVSVVDTGELVPFTIT
jgi:hypothetical protein